MSTIPKYKVSVSFVLDTKDKAEAIAQAAKMVGEMVEYVSAKKIDTNLLKDFANDAKNQIFGS